MNKDTTGDCNYTNDGRFPNLNQPPVPGNSIAIDQYISIIFNIEEPYYYRARIYRYNSTRLII